MQIQIIKVSPLSITVYSSRQSSIRNYCRMNEIASIRFDTVAEDSNPGCLDRVSDSLATAPLRSKIGSKITGVLPFIAVFILKHSSSCTVTVFRNVSVGVRLVPQSVKRERSCDRTGL